ncbi:FAD-dependent monooxygenase [Novosphingobium colocasiae]
MAQIDVPVLIAGGGPVGMTTALNLARYGIRSLLVERNPTTTRHPKMDLTNGRSMELFHRLGLDEKPARCRRAARKMRSTSCGSPRWSGTTCTGSTIRRPPRRPISSVPRMTAAMAHKRRSASARYRSSRSSRRPSTKNPLIDVRFGTRFDKLVENGPDGVIAEIVNEATGESDTVHCRFLAGCDGGGSRVRRNLGIQLDGEEKRRRGVHGPLPHR